MRSGAKSGRIGFQTNLLALTAAASAEQASGIDPVNEAITQMDEMTRQNAFFDIAAGGRRR